VTRPLTTLEPLASAGRLQAKVGTAVLVVFAFSLVWIVAHVGIAPAPISVRFSSADHNVIASGTVPTAQDRDALLLAIAGSSPNGIVVSTVELDASATPPGDPTITASQLLSQLIGDDN